MQTIQIELLDEILLSLKQIPNEISQEKGDFL